MYRAVDLAEGTAYVVSDLHGSWEIYARYRDHFLSLYNQKKADYLIFLGDLIHGHGPPDTDASVGMLLDVIGLQQYLGADKVIMLLGNHELPHIYGVTLSKDDHNFTGRFEHALGQDRPEIIAFLKSCPFLVRTSGGTLMTHAGPSATVLLDDTVENLLNFSHQDLLDEADRLMGRDDVIDLLDTFLHIDIEQYTYLSEAYLAVDGTLDPRYPDLLRGILISNMMEWGPLWDFFFTQCEVGLTTKMYRRLLERFFQAYSRPEAPQHVLVTGHMTARNGAEIIADLHLRLASWTHAIPQEEGRFLLHDVSTPVRRAKDLLPSLQRLPQ